jgi:hypothetical protein
MSMRRPSFRVSPTVIATLTLTVAAMAAGWGALVEKADLRSGIPFNLGGLWQKADQTDKSTPKRQIHTAAYVPGAASTANYVFAADNSGSFTDMSFGTTKLIGPDADDAASLSVPMGFEFYLMGNRYTEFSVNSNGLIALGSTPVASSAYSVTGGTTATPIISAFGGDLRVGSSGKVHYRVSGSAPNRILTIEFLNMSLLSVPSPGTNDGTFQVRLYETSGKIEFVYGPMVRNVGTGAGNGQAAGIGFAVDTVTNGFVSISSVTNTANMTAPFIEQTYSSGTIANLNSSTDGLRRIYSLTPPSGGSAPTGISFSDVTSNGMTLNWSDAADEIGYAVYRSTDGGSTYSFHATTASDSTSLAVTGLQPGQSYLWRVYSLKEGGPVGSPLAGSQSTAAAGSTYYWVGSTGGDWNAATNWNTASDGSGTDRATPNGSDVLIIDGDGTTAGGNTTIKISGSQSIGAIRITNGTSCSLRSVDTSVKILTISGNGGDDLAVQTGSSLGLNDAADPVKINFSTSTGMTGKIDGTVSFLGGASTENALDLTGGSGTRVIVTGTGVIDLGVQSDAMFVGTADSLFIEDGGTVNSSGATTGAPPIPLATWGQNSNLNISGLTTSSSTPTNNEQDFGNVTFDCPAATGAFNLFGTSTNGSVRGTLKIQATNTGKFVGVSGGDVEINDLIVNGGTFEAASLAGGRVLVTGNVIQTDGIIDVSSGNSVSLFLRGNLDQSSSGILKTSGGSGNTIEFQGSASQTLKLSNTVTGPLSFRVNNAAGIDLQGALSINDNATLIVSSGNVSGTGSISYGTTSGALVYNGSSGVQTATAVEFPVSAGPVNLTVNNTAAPPNSKVIIPFDRTLPAVGVLGLESGILSNSGNLITILNPAVGAVTGASDSNFINGAIARALPSGLDGSTDYSFATGKAAFNPFELIAPVTSAPIVVKAEVFDTNSGGTGGYKIGSLHTDRYWAASIVSGSGLTSTFVRVSDASSAATDAIAASSAVNGSYNLVGGISPTVVVGSSITSTAPAATSLPGFFALGTTDNVPPTISYTPLANTFSTSDQTVSVTIADAVGVAQGANRPRIYYKKGLGSYFSNACTLSTGNSVSGVWNCTILASDITPIATDNISYFIIAQDTAGNLSAEPLAGLNATDVNNVVTPPASPNSYKIISRFSGSVNVGSGEAITSLTNSGGLFEQINEGAVNGDLTILLTSDLTGETGAVGLTQTNEEGVGNWTITIKPFSGPRIVSGSAATCLIDLDGADRVTLDGAVAGSSKDTTFTNTSTSGATICLENGANANTIKNLIVNGVGTSAASGTVYFGGTTAAGGNANNSVVNTTIKSGSSAMTNGIYLSGTSGKNSDANTISKNVISDFSGAGIYLDNYYPNTTITENSIFEATPQSSSSLTGIYLNFAPGTTNVLRNKVYELATTAASPTIRGIHYANGSGGDTINIVNNFIDLDASATTDGAVIFGFDNSGTSGNITNFWNNSVRIGGSSVSTGTTASLYLHGAGTLNSVNNILANFRANGSGTGTHFSVRVRNNGDLAGFSSDHNDLFTPGTGGAIGTIDDGATILSSVGDWQTGANKDPNSISGDPQFVSAADLHLTYASPTKNAGFTIGSVIDDIDGNDRPKDGGYDIGADEYIDSNAPETSITGNPADPTNSISATFTFSGTDSLKAPSAVNGFQCRLDGDAYAICLSPKTYNSLAEGSHTFSVYAIDASGNADATPAQFTWVIDTTPPTTNITTHPNDPTNSTSAGFSFTGTDTAGSGVAGFTCKLDSEPAAACYSGSVSYSGLAAGSHTFEVAATDNAGNSDASPATFSWTIDLTPPETLIDTMPADPTSSTSAAFTFSATNFAAAEAYTYSCSLDNAAFSNCTSPATFTGLSDGSHNFRVKATDSAGNEDTTPATYTWVIDSTAPSVSIDPPTPPDPSNSPSGTFKFSGTDVGGSGVTGYVCSIDGAAFTNCTSPYSYSSLADGPHSFAVRSVDAAGNQSTPATFSWVLDTLPPDTNITGKPTDPSNSSSATFTFTNTGTEPPIALNRPSAPADVTFECSLDAAAFASCVSGINYTGLTDGSHIFKVRAIDAAGNVDATPAQYTWIVDTVPPSATIDDPKPANPSNNSTATFNFSGTDTGGTGVTGFVCSLDGSAFATCLSPQALSSLGNGSHTFSVKAIDAAGNVSSATTFTWTIDLNPPDTTIVTKPFTPTNNPDTTFTFSGTDTLFGPESVASFQCKLDSGSYSACTSTRSYGTLGDGSHTFSVYAVDDAGNIDPTPAQYTWFIDTTDPDTTIATHPANTTASTSASLTFSGSDTGGSGVINLTCKLDANAPTNCTSGSVSYSGLSSGSHTFTVFATDNVGNFDATPATFTWLIDFTSPAVSIDPPTPLDPANSSSATFNFSGTDPGGSGVTGFLCSLDAAAFAACSSPKSYSGLADGSHNFAVKSVDAAGNESGQASYSWTIDTAAPDTTIVSGPGNPSYEPDATFTFTNVGSLAAKRGQARKTAAAVTFECKLDAAPFAVCTSAQSYSGLANGPHTFQVRAIDAAGNVDPTPATYPWTVNVPPGPVDVFASAGEPGPSSYPTLKAAFDAVNSGFHQGNISINISGNSTATASAVLKQSGTGAASYSSILIQPVRGARTISGSVNGPLIDLDGAKNVTINGRNTGGNSLTITNNALGSASTIRFINDASNNTITAATLRGSPDSASGVVFFGTGNTTGNSNNNINNCSITATDTNQPINGIYSSGSAENTQNTIDSNKISDFFNAAASSNGIELAAGNSAWTITNNKFYQTGVRIYSAAALHSAISISSGGGYAITGNSIGGASPSGGGFYIMGGSVATRFVAIDLSVAASPITSVQGNSVSAVLLTTTSSEITGSGVLCGLSINSGNVNVGNVTPNIIGVAEGTDSLVVTPLSSQGAVVGVNAGSTGTVLISNNVIGGLISGSTADTIGGAVFGINISNDATSITVNGNTIGNEDADSLRAGIQASTTAGSTAIGIYQTGLPLAANYLNNTIQNISSWGTGNNGHVSGIEIAQIANNSVAASIGGNTIGNLATNSSMTEFPGGMVSAAGVHILSGSGTSVSSNTIKYVSNINNGAVSTVVAGVSHAVAANTAITNNRIYGLANASTSVSAVQPGIGAGILVRSGTTAVTVANNMISLGGGQYTNTVFIGIWSNHGSTPVPVDQIYFNTIRIEGNASSGALPTMGFERGDLSAIARTATIDLRNNLISNVRAGSTGKHYAISNNYGSPSSSATGWPAGASNYNVLNANVSTVGYWSGVKTLAGWRSASLSDDLSFTNAPVSFVNSLSDLHINLGATTSPIESGGQPIPGFQTDIDGQTRPGPAGSVNGGAFQPDIGADEYDGTYQDSLPPTISYTPLPNITTTGTRTLAVNVFDATGVALGGNAPRIFYRKSTDAAYVSTPCSLASGTNQSGVFNCTINYINVGGGFVTTGNTIQYFVAAQDLYGNLVGNPSNGFAGTNVINVTSPPTPPNSYRIALPYNGNYSVGSGGAFASLTNPGGLFDVINSGVATGNITINIVSDLAGETGAVALNQVAEEGAGGYSVTVKPSGGVRMITGSSSGSIIKLNGADRITIDGSVSGGTDRSLTIVNSGSGAVVWVGTNSVSGANNVTVKNAVLKGPGSFSGQGIVAGSSTGIGVAAENGRPNSGLTIQNNVIASVQNAIYTAGDQVTRDQGLIVSGNVLGSSTVAEKLSVRGIAIQNAVNFQITGNHILGVASSVSATATVGGILVAGLIDTGKIDRNEIRDVKQKGTVGGSNGIWLTTISTAANVTITNNFISDIASNGSAGSTSADNGYGIMLDGGAGYKIYHNTVNMNTNQASPNGITAAMNIGPAVNTPGGIDLRNNILANTQTVGTRYGLYNSSNASIFAFINYNDYFAQNVGFLGSDMATLATWQGVTSQDGNSSSADPIFVGASDLHLQAGSPMIDHAVTLPGITLDYDGDTRPSGIANDIGADERVGGVIGPPARVSGRVVSSGGRGADGVIVTLTDNVSGAKIYALTNHFGYFVMPSAPTGVAYTLSVTSKRYTFTPNSRTFTLAADRPNENFTADP